MQNRMVQTASLTLAATLFASIIYDWLVARQLSTTSAVPRIWWLAVFSSYIAAFAVMAYRTSSWRELVSRMLTVAVTLQIYSVVASEFHLPGGYKAGPWQLDIQFWLGRPIAFLVLPGIMLILFYLLRRITSHGRPHSA